MGEGCRGCEGDKAQEKGQKENEDASPWPRTRSTRSRASAAAEPNPGWEELACRPALSVRPLVSWLHHDGGGDCGQNTAMTGIDNVPRTLHIHTYIRRGRGQLQTRGAANADGDSAQAATLPAFGLVGRHLPSLADAASARPCSRVSAWLPLVSCSLLLRLPRLRYGVRQSAAPASV